MASYVQDFKICRRVILFDHFAETFAAADCKNHCDTCSRIAKLSNPFLSLPINSPSLLESLRYFSVIGFNILTIGSSIIDIVKIWKMKGMLVKLFILLC